jgi:hypothetical protein
MPVCCNGRGLAIVLCNSFGNVAENSLPQRRKIIEHFNACRFDSLLDFLIFQTRHVAASLTQFIFVVTTTGVTDVSTGKRRVVESGSGEVPKMAAISDLDISPF